MQRAKCAQIGLVAESASAKHPTPALLRYVEAFKSLDLESVKKADLTLTCAR